MITYLSPRVRVTTEKGPNHLGNNRMSLEYKFKVGFWHVWREVQYAWISPTFCTYGGGIKRLQQKVLEAKLMRIAQRKFHG
jgi:hypothetical protein